MKVYSVSEFVQSFNSLLGETIPAVAVSGEISGFRVSQDRMVFFDLKDAKSKILCFALKWEIPQELSDGMSVQIIGSPRLFATSGQFHIRVTDVQVRGEGALQKIFRERISRLEKEGLFADERKKQLPRFPETIGLITSEDAAAYTDVLKIFKEKIGCTIRLYPVKVQGLGSESSVIRAFQYFNKYAPVEVIMLVRGGGSLEDLQTFNSERVARTIVASRIPVVVGVGHERDVTIADMVADRRASTPTNAAEIVLPSKREMLEFIGQKLEDIHDCVEGMVRGFQSSLAHLVQRMRYAFARMHSEFDVIAAKLSVLDPQAVLKKGYTVTRKDRRVITAPSQVCPGEMIETRFFNGSILSRVQK